MPASTLFELARKLDLSNLPRRAERVTYVAAQYVDFFREWGGICIDTQLTNNAAVPLLVSETQFDTGTETIPAGFAGIETNVLHDSLYLQGFGGGAVNVDCKFGILEADVIAQAARRQRVR